MSLSRIVADAALVRCLASFLLVCATGCSDSNETARLQLVPDAEAVRSVSQPIAAGLSWPAAQLLPSFPAPAAVQDLILLHGQAEQWEAEGPSLSHKTGRLETDGWLCQVGVDTANEHMIYGPYDTTIPAGANTAQFHMKTDNNTADDVPLVTLEVYDSSAGQSLASQVVTRKQFTVAGDYTSFSLPFVLGADNHALELRVLWSGAAYTKVDWVGVSRSQADDEMVLFASLKGTVNAKQPRMSGTPLLVASTRMWAAATPRTRLRCWA